MSPAVSQLVGGRLAGGRMAGGLPDAPGRSSGGRARTAVDVGLTRSAADVGRTRSAAGGAPDPRQQVLLSVPRPVGGAAAVVLEDATAGALSAVRADWGPDGGQVLLSGRASFAEVTGQAGFRADGSWDGGVRMAARISLLGLPLGDVSWAVASWSPEQPLAMPAAALHGSTMRVDLGELPAGSVWSPAAGVDARRRGEQLIVRVPSSATTPAVAPPRAAAAQAYLGLLGPAAGLAPSAPAGAQPQQTAAGSGQGSAAVPSFVADADVFLAPAAYGPGSPEALRVLRGAVRSALANLLGPLAGDTGPLVPQPPPGPAAPPAPAAVLSARAAEPSASVGTARPLPEGSAGAPTPAAPVEDTAEPAATMEGAAAGAAPGPAAGGPQAGPPVPGLAGASGGPPAEPGAGVVLLMPEPPTEPGPAAQERAAAVAAGGRRAARSALDLPPAGQNVADARGAVAEPAAETAARAREQLAGELGGRQPPSPEIVALCERIRTAIRDNRPEDEDELIETDPTREAQDAGATVTGSVQTQTSEVGHAYDAMASPPAGTPALTPVPVVDPPRGSAGTGVDAGTAAPDPIAPENTSLDADVAATDQRIADSGIDTRVTREIPDGPFAEARAARGELGEAAERTPQQIQAQQQQAIDSAQADMAELQLQAVAAMRAARGGTVGAISRAQGGMVASEGTTREGAAARAQGFYNQAKDQVDKLLGPLPKKAIDRWDAGLARLSQDFHDALNRVKRWIGERHSGAVGTLLEIGDYFSGLPDWVTDEYNRAERAFGDGVCTLLLEISSDVNGVVAAARGIIQTAREDIEGEFDRMEEQFPEWAAKERARFAGMLGALEQRTVEAQTSFTEDVSRRAVDAVNEVHAEAQARREEARGLVGRVAAAIEEFIDDPIRAIINGLLRLVGIPPAAFWSLVAKIEQVISDIADDPEGFINNLTAGLRLGFEWFFDHFGKHLLAGFWDWLFSGLESPVPLPRDFSVRSLVAFALQLMGVTWPRVREILVRHLGPTAVEVVETAWRLVSMLIERGPEGLVELVKEQLSPEALIGMVLDAALDYLQETLIEQVAVRVFALLNPVGAIAQAIELIYQVCAWVFRNAARIFRFIEAVVNGLADVVAGNISGLATAVENALASLIPPVIDFLAGLLHLGGLPGEVADVIVRLQAAVYAAMDRVIGLLAERGRALLARMGIGGQDGAAEGGNDDELGTTVRFRAGTEGHRTWIDRSGAEATPMVASSPLTLRERIRRWGEELDAVPADPAAAAAARTAEKRAKLAELVAVLDRLDREADALAQGFETANRDPRDTQHPPDDDSLEGQQRSMANLLREAFILFEGRDPDEYLRDIAANIGQHGRGYADTAARQWQPALRRPSLAPGGAPIWDPSPVSPDGAVAWLGDAAVHRQLLPWFLVGGQNRPRSAATGTFANHAFETDAPEPPHVVRSQFLTVLGNDTVANMKDVAGRKIAAEDNADLLQRIQSITYTSSGGRWGSFPGLPGDAVSPLVKTAIDRAGGVVGFLRKMVQPGQYEGVTWQGFLAVWRSSPQTKDYVKGLFRRVLDEHHEWIPSGYIPEVVERAVESAVAGDVRSGLRWITAHNELRSPTRWVLSPPRALAVTEQGSGFLPGRSPRGQPTHRGAAVSISMSGHEGAFRKEGTGEQAGRLVIKGWIESREFHDWLRNEFNANSSLGPLGYIRHLQDQLATRVWDGGTSMIPDHLLGEPVGLYYRLDSGEDVSNLTIAQLALRQRLNWQRIADNFAKAYDRTQEAGV